MKLLPLRGPKKRIRKTSKFLQEWQELQMLCKDPNTWADALYLADKLLDKALKKRKFKGSTMGERLVSAQKYITDNDDIWDAHNLVKKLYANNDMKLKDIDAKEALISFREALRDLGALELPSTNSSKQVVSKNGK